MISTRILSVCHPWTGTAFCAFFDLVLALLAGSGLFFQHAGSGLFFGDNDLCLMPVTYQMPKIAKGRKDFEEEGSESVEQES